MLCYIEDIAGDVFPNREVGGRELAFPISASPLEKGAPLTTRHRRSEPQAKVAGCPWFCTNTSPIGA